MTDLPEPSDETPPARKKRRPTQQVVNLLLEAATEEFKRYGYAAATTAAIARKAGATEAQLFRYFRSKADLFRESVFEELDRHFAEFNARNLGEEVPVGDLRDLSGQYITELQNFLREHHELFLTLFVTTTYAPKTSPGVDDVDNLRAYFDRGADLTARNSAGRDMRIDPRLLVRLSFGAVLASVMFKSWLFPPGLATDREIERAVIDFVLDGISSSTPPATPRAPPRPAATRRSPPPRRSR